MALLESTMIPLGTPMPQFSLLDVVTGGTISSDSLAGKPALLMLICNHCPYVVRIKGELSRLGAALPGEGVAVVALSSNDAETYPADGPAEMKADAAKYEYPFPYLYDESQAIAQALQAVCTPEFYLYDAAGKLTYRGRLDDSTPGNGKPTTSADLLRALDALKKGEPPIEPQMPSMGCSIKWKAGAA